MSKTLNTINGETLMNTFIPPTEFVVKDLIAQGLHVLSGSPKTGKSWFALMLCLKVATGETLWKFETKQGTALYLCLEDSIARIQSRLFDITDDAPSDIHFATVAECIGYGIEEQIENFCKEHPNTRLVVIDTFQKIRTLSNDNAYASDYHDVSFLKSIADKLKIAIVLIHHLRKQKDDDPMNMVSGTTGITGGADSNFVLIKTKRSSTRATLSCTGRDIEYKELEINFDSDSKLWELISDSVENPEVLLEDITSTVVKFMKNEKSFSGTPAELAERLSAYTKEEISPIVLSKRLNQNIPELEEFGVRYKSKRSNGKRLIFLSGFPQNPDGFVGGGEHTEQESLVACNETIKRCAVRRSAASDGNIDIPITDPTVPVSEGSDEAVETERGF